MRRLIATCQVIDSRRGMVPGLLTRGTLRIDPYQVAVAFDSNSGLEPDTSGRI